MERELPSPPHQPSGYGRTGDVSHTASRRVRAVIEPAPPYRGEGPRALWHVSEDPTIESFRPRDEKVWAIDTRHLPLYWFPRDCPRATFWAKSATTEEDVGRFLSRERTRRVHVVEPSALDSMRSTRVVAYRLPPETFEPWDRFWISSAPVEPIELVELGDLVGRHEEAGIALQSNDDLLALWERVVDSTLDYSGIRLRNAVAR
jgi:hypothetical protein